MFWFDAIFVINILHCLIKNLALYRLLVCWFAGLFYLVRLFIYFKESEKKPELERTVLENQFILMTKRLLYIITWPSAILTTIFGLSMIYLNTALLDNQWMKVKLCFVFYSERYHFHHNFLQSEDLHLLQ